MDFYLKSGFNGAIEMLLNYDQIDEAFPVPVETFKNPKQNRVPMQGVSTWWALRMMMTRRPLQEKMTLFWHNHFATSASKVTAPMLMYGQNEIFRRNAIGNFRNLLSEVSKDPAMILWLDSQQNVKGHANENFAREVMELFTLGIGHYSEKDIQEGARAFTGWSIRRTTDPATKAVTASFVDRPGRHDEGSKTFLGSSGNFNGDDVLNILCDQPRTAEFIAWKMWSWFGYLNPEPKLIQRLASKFHQSGMEIKVLLREMMTAPEFFSHKAERSVFKNPADVCITTLRQLGVGELVGDAFRSSALGVLPAGRAAPAGAAAAAMKAMGMWLLYPPDVSGWKFGPAWISSATMVERMAWADQLFGQSQSTKLRFRIPAFALLSRDTTPRGVTATILSAFDASLNREKVAVLVKTAEKASDGELTPENAGRTAAAVCRLLFASPEFQMM